MQLSSAQQPSARRTSAVRHTAPAALEGALTLLRYLNDVRCCSDVVITE
jgi:hypothetical protein